jgi:hypothetical protein
VTHRSNFLKLSAHITMAEVAGTALDSKSYDFVLNRRHVPILAFNADGHVLLAYAHAVPAIVRGQSD